MAVHNHAATHLSPAPTLILCCGMDSSPEYVTEALNAVDRTFQYDIVSRASAIRTRITQILTEEGTDESPIVVMPVTSGRNVTLISDSAKACVEVCRDYPDLTLALADAPLNSTKTVSWLRKSIRKHTQESDFATICAKSIDEFADAELFRLARLAWAHSSGADVDVAFDDCHPAVADVVKLRLGEQPARHHITIRADLHTSPGQLPLMSPIALGTAIKCSLHGALHLLHDHGENGIESAFFADHEHGYAHSHGDEDGHSHSHGHSHTHSHEGGAHAH